MNKIILIPDVHGRQFWRKAVSLDKTTPIVFLGDYLDPYWGEGIDAEEAYEELDEIIGLKRMSPERVTLLLGNHDLHYLTSQMGGCRFDWRHAYQNKALLWSNLRFFDIAHFANAGDKQYLFTHAGVLKAWYGEHYGDTLPATAKGISSRLNEQLHNSVSQPKLYESLSNISPIRGGTHLYGSPVWADESEHHKDRAEFDGIYQVFGHTLMQKEKITPYWACLDCIEAFVLELESAAITKI